MALMETDCELPVAAHDAHTTAAPAVEAPGIALLKAAKLICGSEETFCLIRNLAPDRLVADTHVAVEPGSEVRVMLTEEVVLIGTAGWTEEDRLEVRFAGPVDLPALLPRLAKGENGHPARMPRLKVEAWARLRVGSRLFSVRVCDISQGGAKIQVHGLTSPVDDAVLTIQGLRPVQGVVRWRRGDDAGVSFNHALGFVELVEWLERHRSGKLESPHSSIAH